MSFVKSSITSVSVAISHLMARDRALYGRWPYLILELISLPWLFVGHADLVVISTAKASRSIKGLSSLSLSHCVPLSKGDPTRYGEALEWTMKCSRSSYFEYCRESIRNCSDEGQFWSHHRTCCPAETVSQSGKSARQKDPSLQSDVAYGLQ